MANYRDASPPNFIPKQSKKNQKTRSHNDLRAFLCPALSDLILPKLIVLGPLIGPTKRSMVFVGPKSMETPPWQEKPSR